MTADQIPTLIMQIVDELRADGILIISRARKCCVVSRNGTGPTACRANDLQDAVEHGRVMAAAASAPAPAKAPGRQRRKGHRPMTAKAARRAFIKKHNRRMRARVLRLQRSDS